LSSIKILTDSEKRTFDSEIIRVH